MKRRYLAAPAAAAFAVTAVVLPIAHADDGRPSAQSTTLDPLGHLNGAGSLVVDFSDPAKANQFLDALPAPYLDGLTVVVNNLRHVSPADRRAETDASYDGAVDEADEGLCPTDLPVEATDRGATPVLPCDPSDGDVTAGKTVTGNTGPSISKALGVVVNRTYADADLPAPSVAIDGHVALVDFPDDFAQVVSPSLTAQGASLVEALAFTAATNSDIDAVIFTLGGDCVEFALAVGGDSCSKINVSQMR